MAARTLSLTLALALALATFARAQTMPGASPAPEDDIPMYPAEPMLVLWTAGMDGSTAMAVKPITQGMHICPSDYPTGINVECRGPMDVTRTAFFVNSRRVRVEYHHPYFLAGNLRDGTVNKWMHPKRVAWIRCRLFGLGDRTVVKAKVEFKC